MPLMFLRQMFTAIQHVIHAVIFETANTKEEIVALLPGLLLTHMHTHARSLPGLLSIHTCAHITSYTFTLTRTNYVYAQLRAHHTSAYNYIHTYKLHPHPRNPRRWRSVTFE